MSDTNTQLPEICESSFDHSPIEHLPIDKTYFMKRGPGPVKIICSECISAWIPVYAKSLADHIMTLIDAVDSRKTQILQEENDSTVINDVFSMTIMEDIFDDVMVRIESNITYSEYDVPDLKSAITLIFRCNDTVFSPRININSSGYNSAEQCYCKNKTQALAFRIEAALEALIQSMFRVMNESEVEEMIENKQNAGYDSIADGYIPGTCPCDEDDAQPVIGKCAICEKGLTDPSYKHHNKVICLDCMYNIVVHRAVRENLAEDVGLAADMDTVPTAVYNIHTTKSFKRAVIDKYFNITNSKPTSNCGCNCCKVQ